MRHRIKTYIFVILSLFCGLSYFSETALANTFSFTSSATQVSPGATFTVSISSDGFGRVNLQASGGTLSSSAVWIDGDRQSITVTAGASGTVTVIATPEVGFSDPDGEIYNPGQRTVSVKIITPTPTTPTTPASSSSPSNPKPTTQAPAQNNTNNTNTSTTDKPATETTTQNPVDDNPEITEETITDNGSENEPNEDICLQQKRDLAFAWTIAIVFALLFFITLAILIYFILKIHKKPESKPESKTSAPKVKTTPAKKPKSKKAKKVS